MIQTQTVPYWVNGADGQPRRDERTERFFRMGRFGIYWYKPARGTLIIRVGMRSKYL